MREALNNRKQRPVSPVEMPPIRMSNWYRNEIEVAAHMAAPMGPNTSKMHREALER